MGVEKRADADKKRHEDNKVILTALKNLTERVTGLEAEVAALRAENEQLKQNTQHETIQIGDITLPSDDNEFLLVLSNCNHESLSTILDSLDMLRVKFLINIARAKKLNDTILELEVIGDYIYAAKNLNVIVSDEYISMIKSKSWGEIVRRTRHMIQDAIKINENLKTKW